MRSYSVIQRFKESLLLTLATKLPEVKSSCNGEDAKWSMGKRRGRERNEEDEHFDRQRAERERRDAAERPQAEEGADARS